MSKKAIVKSASIISSATLFSRVLGFVRDILLAKTFGTGWIAQSFFVAFKIPNMFRDLSAEGASNAALVPVFSQYLATKEREDFWKLVNTAFIAFTIMVSLIAVMGMIFSPLIVRLIAPGFSEMPEKLNLTIAINRPLFGYLILVSIAAFIMGVLHTFKSFFAPSFSPCFFNITFIASIILASNSVSGIWILVWGVLVAGILQILFQLPALFKSGFRIRPFEFQKDIFSHPGVKSMGRLLGPRILGTAIYEFNIIIDTIFASFSSLVGAGGIAAIQYATRMIQFPLGVFGYAVSSAAFPTLSELAAKKEIDKFAETVEFGLTNILFVLLPAGVGMIIMSKPIIRIIFERGEFTPYSTMITSAALTFYAVGLFAYGANRLLALCFNSLHNTITPVKVSSLALVSNIILNTLFVVVLKAKIAGLAFASSISAIMSFLILYNLLHKRIRQINTKRIIFQVIRMFLASTLMALVIIITWQKNSQYLHPIIGVVITICLGAFVYLITGYYLNIYQANHIFRWILKKK